MAHEHFPSSCIGLLNIPYTPLANLPLVRTQVMCYDNTLICSGCNILHTSLIRNSADHAFTYILHISLPAVKNMHPGSKTSLNLILICPFESCTSIRCFQCFSEKCINICQMFQSVSFCHNKGWRFNHSSQQNWQNLFKMVCQIIDHDAAITMLDMKVTIIDSRLLRL